MNTNRRLTITALLSGQFRAVTEYQNTIGYWNTLSTTITSKFPLIIVERVAARSDYRIIVRAQVQQ
jgi:hypothetical protein